MDLAAVRTFVVAADRGQFQAAADELDLTQQAVSRRIAALEKDLGVRLFSRAARGVELTTDGQAFLPHARDLVRAEERALESVRPGGRPLRVDVPSRRVGPAAALRDFHRAHPATQLEVVTLFDAGEAIAAVRSGAIDAAFRALTVPLSQLPGGVTAGRVLDEPHQLLTGPAHPLAAARSVALGQLADYQIWIPGIVPGTEWGAYYEELAVTFGLNISATGPNFGSETFLDVLAESADVAGLVGEQTRLAWPPEQDLRRIAVRDPVPVYPSWLVWRADNPHPGLATLRDVLGANRPWQRAPGTWVPGWAA